MMDEFHDAGAAIAWQRVSLNTMRNSHNNAQPRGRDGKWLRTQFPDDVLPAATTLDFGVLVDVQDGFDEKDGGPYAAAQEGVVVREKEIVRIDNEQLAGCPSRSDMRYVAQVVQKSMTDYSPGTEITTLTPKWNEKTMVVGEWEHDLGIINYSLGESEQSPYTWQDLLSEPVIASAPLLHPSGKKSGKHVLVKLDIDNFAALENLTKEAPSSVITSQVELTDSDPSKT